MGYRALASCSTVLTKYTGCSTRLGASVLVAPSGGSRGLASDPPLPYLLTAPLLRRLLPTSHWRLKDNSSLREHTTSDHWRWGPSASMGAA